MEVSTDVELCCQVSEGQEVMVLEAMKMQNSLVTGKSGKVRTQSSCHFLCMSCHPSTPVTLLHLSPCTPVTPVHLSPYLSTDHQGVGEGGRHCG